MKTPTIAEPVVQPIYTTAPTSRRSFFKSAGMVVAGAGVGYLGGYAARFGKSATKTTWVKPLIGYDRILRVTVGLRPHRASGYIVRTEALGAKTLIHNYGHGGSGWSLSWGCGTLVVDEALKTGEKKFAVVGCGISGLTTARLLQRQGFDVTIYTKECAPFVTSSFAGAGWSPTATLVDEGKFTPEFKEQFTRIARISHRFFQDMVWNPKYGVEYMTAYRVGDAPTVVPGPDYVGSAILDLNGVTMDMKEGTTPFDYKYVTKSTRMRFQVPRYLNAMMQDYQLAGGKVVFKEFKKLEDLDALPEKVVVNCMGLGTKALFNDDQLIPIRGQLTHLIPQPELNYSLAGEGIGASPRADALTCGNSTIPGVWDATPDKIETARVIDGLTNLIEKRSKFA